MNTQEFMVATNIPTQPMVSYYIKHKIIQPSKIGKSYQFTQEDVTTILKYKAGELPKPSKNLKSSISIPETSTTIQSPDGVIKGEHITLTHNVFGELVSDQTEPHFPATYSKRTLNLFFANQGLKPELARSEGYTLDTFTLLSNFIKLAYKVDISTYKKILHKAVNSPDDKMFDENYTLSGVSPRSVYSYNEATAKMVEVRTEMVARRGYVYYTFPNFETFYIAFLKELAMFADCPIMPDYETHWRYSTCHASGKYIGRSLKDMLEHNNIETIFEHTLNYIDKEADTYPATFHKTTKIYHGENKPKALTELGQPKFPSSWEDERYSRYNMKFPDDVNPETPPDPAKVSTEEYTKHIITQRKFAEFKTYYGLI